MLGWAKGGPGSAAMTANIILPDCDPTFCRGLAFLRAHAVMLLARQLWPIR